jgi:UDP-hydrolysing UDP-N-acetyl-D-glucosamine 2-epimerase
VADGRVLFLVPARGGSRRVPGKNLRTVGGVPLVARAIRVAHAAAAQLAGGPHLVVCSTDDQAIAATATAEGAEVLIRPGALATDQATSVDVALHALGALDDPARPVETLVLLQPTSPLTDPADVIASVERHRRSGNAGVTSVVATHPAGWHHALHADGVLHGTIPVADGLDVLLAGAFYVVAPGALGSSRRFVEPGVTLGQVIAPDLAIDVDEEHDLVVAEAILAAPRHIAPAPLTPTAPGVAPASPAEAALVVPAATPGPVRRRVTVLTTGRQDWGILESTCAAIRAHPDLDLDLLVGGMHLSPRHGHTVDEVRADGFEPAAELAWLPADASLPDPPAAMQAAATLAAVSDHLAARRSDVLVIAGDRFETAAAALAATVNRVPIVHLHGGEQTLGAFDDALRHSITKLAHLHLVSNDEHARRVVAMGEDPATVVVVGTPGLDALHRPDPPGRDELAAGLGLPLDAPVVLVTVHPATLEGDPAAAARAVVAAMDLVPATYVVTLPNADPGAAEVRELLAVAAAPAGRVAVDALGSRRYWGLLKVADAMLGNSSSGIAEAPAIGLPVVNVGDRQAGRHRSGTVIDVPADAERVAAALRECLAPGYRASMPPPGLGTADGRVGERVANIIAAWHPTIPPRKAPIVVAS